MKRILKIIFRTGVLLFCVIYAGLIVYAFIPIKSISSSSLQSKNDQFFLHEDHLIRYQSVTTIDLNKPNLILIHGFGNNLGTWQTMAPRLEEFFNVYALDMIGFGLSEKPEKYNYSNASQAKTISSFAKALKIDSFSVGGHSLGGAVAMHTAINDKDVEGLILFNPGIINTGVPTFSKYLNLIFPLSRITAKQFGSRDFREGFLKQSFHNPLIVDESVMDRVMLGSLTSDYISGMSGMLSKFYDANDSQLMKEVIVPTLIIFGIEDKNKSMEEAIQLKNGFINSKLEIIQNAGHYVHEESPETVSKTIIESRNFLTSKNERNSKG